MLQRPNERRRRVRFSPRFCIFLCLTSVLRFDPSPENVGAKGPTSENDIQTHQVERGVIKEAALLPTGASGLRGVGVATLMLNLEHLCILHTTRLRLYSRM